ncbi:type VII secretion-associated serine protease [Streptomyces chrestomyceticus JCM 4735]|uniref:Type VII secretion-associated serine protease n=1 Tax=Streptomyces chrestomyceticus JCM 4735 TaxID=1306181 RepID=A0A7U9PWN6_9ACTN|nr:S8 family serine peptidase [Streptomyces chrestomyceticus]GCD34448.1 type VII secretion-associated serine protease [Streptomyces chrestomyceticus JCM 4735]
MSFTRTLRAVSGAVLAGALVLGTASAASADYIRDGQWALGAFGADDIRRHSTGKNVIVAVIDSGVDAAHPDLKGNVLPGKSFARAGGRADHPTEDAHGTAMAAMIAGHGHGANGSAGIMGLAPDAKILPVMTDSTETAVTSSGFAEPLRYAVDQGAKVVNMSFGSGAIDLDEKKAISYALAKDVLLVAATGNAGTSAPQYPAAAPGVLAVGAVAKDGQVWRNSNYGEHVRLLAPGQGIYSAGLGGKYRQSDGTSDSAAYVSAAAALVRSKFPDLTAGQVANRLTKTAITPDGKSDISTPSPKYGYGIVRPFRALTQDIPAGSKYGPLKAPEVADVMGGGNSGSDTGDSGVQKAAGSSGIGIPPIVIIGVVLVLFVAALVVVIVVVRRKKNNGGPPPGGLGGPGGFGGPGGHAGFPPPQQVGPYQQQPNPYGQQPNPYGSYGSYTSPPPAQPPGQ